MTTKEIENLSLQAAKSGEKVTHPALSLVILCYKAGSKINRFLESVTRNLDSVTSNWEIILVGNYWPDSNDDTPQVVREIASRNKKIHALTKEKQGWMGWDARSGLDLCRGEVIGFIDGDEQMVAEDIAKAYKLLIAQNADIVKPYREKRYDPWIRRANSSVYNVIYNFMFPGYCVNDVNSKPKLICRKAFEKLSLKSDDWFLDAEIMIQARRHQLKLVEFPTIFHKSVHRRSFVRFGAVFEFLKNLMKARIQEFFISPKKH